jgi:hypothetical protein
LAGSIAAQQLAHWKLEEGAGNRAENSGTAALCSLRVINEAYGSSNVTWSGMVPSINGLNHSVAGTNQHNSHYWIQSYGSITDGADDPDALDFGTLESFTLMTRVYWLDGEWNDGVISKYDSWDNPGYFLSLRSIGNDKYLVLYLDDTAGGSDMVEVIYGPDSTLSGRWLTVTAVRDCSTGTNTCRLYVDGVLKQTAINGITGSLANNGRFRLGNLFDGPNETSIHGYIAEAAVWDEVLSNDDIAWYVTHTFDSGENGEPSSIRNPPKRLAVYYGWPSNVNGIVGNLNGSFNVFSQYDAIIFGGGLEEPEHGAHIFTTQLTKMLTNASCEVFGYVDLGVTTYNHSYTTLTNKMSKWHAMGADIFLDDYGYDYGTSRARQISAVDYAHSIGCTAFVNAWNPDHAFSDAYDATYNPDSLPTPLQTNDIYLLESYQIMLGEYRPANQWILKSMKCVDYMEQTGVRMFCVTSSTSTNQYSDKKWWYAYDSCVLYNYHAVGWGESNYSASGDGAGYLPWRPDHTLVIGNEYITNAANRLPKNPAWTDEGMFWIDTVAHTSGFQDTIAPRIDEDVIIFPSNGVQVLIDSEVQIRWNPDDIHDLFLAPAPISLATLNGNQTNTLVTGTTNSGTWTWHVASNAPASDVTVIITAEDTSGHHTSQTMPGTFAILPEPTTLTFLLFISLYTYTRQNP